MSETVNKYQLLGDMGRFLREAFKRDKSARALAGALGLSDEHLLERFQVGFAGESFSRAIPSKGPVREALREIGLLDASGKPVCLARLVVPVLDEHEQVAGFVAIGKDGEKAFPTGLPLYGLNRKAFAEKAVVLTRTALDALLASQAGLAAAPFGMELSVDERGFISRYRPERAYFAAEAPELLRLLQKLEVPCHKLTLAFPLGREGAAAALASAEPIGAELGPDTTVRAVADLLKFDCAGRKYELRDLSPNEADRLRVRLRAQGVVSFHLDTLDLYAGRGRAAFARAASALFAAPENAVEGDLCQMIKKLEAVRAARRSELETRPGYAMTADEEHDALEYLKAPDLLDRVAADLTKMGYVGETLNKKLGYLITISRKLQSPLCGVVVSRPAAGKSRLMETLADLVPPEDLIAFTRITPQALYYAENRSLRHKLVVSGEDEGLAGSDYALRELISAKRIKLAAPVKDSASGKMKTVEYEVEGPISLFYTTTQPTIHHENATRCFLLSLDESADQTSEVLKAQRLARSMEGMARESAAADLRRLHRNVQRLLKSVRVVNPFAAELTFPAHALEMRREHEKYLSLIEAVAVLGQYRRETRKMIVGGREVTVIEVEAADIAQANALMAEVLEAKSEELSRPSRELLKLIKQMVDERAREQGVEPGFVRFNRRDIRDFTSWSDNQIKAHIGRLQDLEYLVRVCGRRGQEYRYELGGAENAVKRIIGLKEVGKLGLGGSSWVKETEALYAGKSITNHASSWVVG